MPEYAKQPDNLPTNKVMAYRASVAALYGMLQGLVPSELPGGLTPWREVILLVLALLIALVPTWFVPDRPNVPV